MTVPDENREDILEGLAYIALIPIEDAEIKEHIAKLVASVALQIGGEPFMMDLNKKLLDAGVPAEDARYVTPQAVPTKLIMTMNARELLHFFSIRTCNRAQWEIREMADEMLRICRKVAPEIFGKAGPGCVTGRCPEKRPCGAPRKIDEWG